MGNKILDLCCGMGGFSLGLLLCNNNDSFIGVDIWDTALESYEHNIQGETILCDIKNLDPSIFSNIYCLIGSPECKTFSGQSSYKGKRVKDMSIVKAFMNLVDQIKPKFWIMENVTGLFKSDIKSELDDLHISMNFKAHKLYANDFGLYHKRPRKFFGNFPEPIKGPRRKKKHSTIMASEYKIGLKIHDGRLDSCSKYFGHYLHPLEYAFLMGFPYYIEDRTIKLSGNKIDQVIQVGNAVCPVISKRIYEGILNYKDLFAFA